MKMTLNKETRFSTIEKFDGESKEAMIVEGYAIVFNQETMIGNSEYGFIEVIDDRALDTTNFKDVPLKYNHTDNRLILARTRNGSLTLKVDEFGLKVRAELIDTQSNRDVYKSIEAGLLDKMSFAFTVKEQSWDRTGDIPKRTITQIDRLYDVSVVDLPAYEGTSIDAIARSLELADARIKALENEKDEETKAVIRKRLKLKTND
ncbi:MAG: HK97 family phage prohead protease [Bacilli bacterium]|jgi:HK97 family phage prohead protease